MRAKRMIFFAGVLVSAAGFFRGIKQAQTDSLVADFNFGPPAFVFLAHACVPAFVVATLSAIMRVFNVGRFAQITKTIIRPIAVNVVNLMRGPLARHVYPRQTMSEVKRVIKPNYSVPVFYPATCFSSRRTFASFSFPSEYSRFRVVINEITKAIRRKFVLHGTVNINYWRGCQA